MADKGWLVPPESYFRAEVRQGSTLIQKTFPAAAPVVSGEQVTLDSKGNVVPMTPGAQPIGVVVHASSPSHVVVAQTSSQGVINRMSQPSTQEAPQGRAKQPSMSSEDEFDLPPHYGLGLPEWWLIPPDGGYPFIEYEELTEKQRSAVLQHKCSEVLSDVLAKMLEYTQSDDLQKLIAYVEKIAKPEFSRGIKADTTAVQHMARALVELLMERKAAPKVKYREGLMMAEQRQIERFKAQGHQAFLRRVAFREPLPAFTMLYGDHVARPGDMLTAMTVEETHQTFPDPKGAAVHVAKAWNL